MVITSTRSPRPAKFRRRDGLALASDAIYYCHALLFFLTQVSTASKPMVSARAPPCGRGSAPEQRFFRGFALAFGVLLCFWLSRQFFSTSSASCAAQRIVNLRRGNRSPAAGSSLFLFFWSLPDCAWSGRGKRRGPVSYPRVDADPRRWGTNLHQSFGRLVMPDASGGQGSFFVPSGFPPSGAVTAALTQRPLSCLANLGSLVLAAVAASGRMLPDVVAGRGGRTGGVLALLPMARLSRWSGTVTRQERVSPGKALTLSTFGGAQGAGDELGDILAPL